MPKLYWISNDRQASLPGGEYETRELAEAAIEPFRDEILSACSDDEQRADALAGAFEIEEG